MYLIAGLVGVLSAVFNPSRVKLAGELVPSGRLVPANFYLGVSRNGAELEEYLVGAGLVRLVAVHPEFCN
jgi:hypothetical protein